MRCIAYVRVSREGQDLGPQVQRDAITAWAVQHGHTIEAWHEDHLSGGKKAEDRPGLFAALAAMKALGKGSALIVHKRDRLARDVAVAAAAEATAERAGCRVLSTDGVGAGTDPTSRLMRGLFDLLAEWERGVIRARTKSALAVRKAQGLRVSRFAPYGYRHENGVTVPDQTEQATITRARELRSQGLGGRKTLRVLAAEGHTGRAGRPISVRVLAAI